MPRYGTAPVASLESGAIRACEVSVKLVPSREGRTGVAIAVARAPVNRPLVARKPPVTIPRPKPGPVK